MSEEFWGFRSGRKFSLWEDLDRLLGKFSGHRSPFLADSLDFAEFPLGRRLCISSIPEKSLQEQTLWNSWEFFLALGSWLLASWLLNSSLFVVPFIPSSAGYCKGEARLLSTICSVLRYQDYCLGYRLDTGAKTIRLLVVFFCGASFMLPEKIQLLNRWKLVHRCEFWNYLCMLSNNVSLWILDKSCLDKIDEPLIVPPQCAFPNKQEKIDGSKFQEMPLSVLSEPDLASQTLTSYDSEPHRSWDINSTKSLQNEDWLRKPYDLSNTRALGGFKLNLTNPADHEFRQFGFMELPEDITVSDPALRM
ncbi:hypothetical protein VNO77_34468 [Canavalia gladiata]|uniref:Uncharacterized protein n=1 Tax=Canavalia gladiata TaxID=3824 RepID=A0AAN9KFK7_CANGL